MISLHSIEKEKIVEIYSAEVKRGLIYVYYIGYRYFMPAGDPQFWRVRTRDTDNWIENVNPNYWSRFYDEYVSSHIDVVGTFEEQWARVQALIVVI